jgi:hypothetical protein
MVSESRVTPVTPFRCWRCTPAKLRGVRYAATSRSIPRVRDRNAGSSAGDDGQATCPQSTHKNPGFEAAGGQHGCFGDIQEVGAPGMICPGRGTRASANTSGSDFTWRLWGPGEIADLKIRTERRKLVSSAGPF